MGLLLGSLTKYLFWFYGLMLLVFVNSGLSKKNVSLLCSIMMVRAAIMMLQLSSGITIETSAINSILDMVLSINTLAQIAQLGTREEFAETYVSHMSYICAISLVFFALQISPLKGKILSVARFDGIYIHNFIHLWGWNNNIWRTELFSRNAGPWWEPGAFQCFITVAMLMIMSGRCENNRKLRIKFLVLLVTWITTQSTTGYIIMGIVLALMYRRTVEIVFQKPFREISPIKKNGIWILAFIALIFFFQTIGLENIQEKFSGDNDSASIRLLDVTGSFAISMKSPWIGLGENLMPHYTDYGIVNNSAALLTLCMLNGWPYLIFFCYLLLSGLRCFFEEKLKWVSLGAGLVILTITMTEGIVTLPIMFVYFVHYLDSSKECLGMVAEKQRG